MKKLVLVFLLYFSCRTTAWKIFYRGRQLGGNVRAPETTNHTLPSAEWYTQKLDHFNPTDERTWQQRFYTNASFFDPDNGPVFLMIGGEGEATANWMVEGAWINYAQQYNALCFQLEHRYYGKSHPTSDLSTKNLQYLTSQQALADLATFIESMNVKYELSSCTKWIVFGGSYPGSLAAWMRLKYPYLVHGAMSASGPLVAQIDFKEYYQVVYNSLETYSPDCLKQVKEGTVQINLLLKHMIGQKSINKKFKLCDPVEEAIKNSLDIANFYESLASNFAGVVQYNKDNRQGKSAKAARITIDTVCKIMTNKSIESALDRLAAVNSLLLNTYDQECLDYKYDKMIKQLQNVSLENEGARQWTYQTCTEFGFFQTSSFMPQIFGDQFPVEFFARQCMDIFGPKFNLSFLKRAARRTNTMYGALDLEVSNVVFVHGSVDPWHALGITQTRENAAPAIYIKGTAHCANMYPPGPKDLPQLKAARVQISQLIGDWLSL